MHKFFPVSFLTFLLAISFLLPVHDVSAETSASGMIRSVISPVFATQKETHNYNYVVCKGAVASAKPSFFARLLAAVGITQSLPAQKLAESSAGCGVWGIIGKVTNSMWSCIPSNVSSTCSNETSKRTDTVYYGAKYTERYGVTFCTITHIYKKGLGTITHSCLGSRTPAPSTTKVTYPPVVDASGIGSYSGSSLISANMRDSFSVTESIESMLTVYPMSGSDYTVPISVTLSQARFNNETKEFNYKSVPCTSITVAGKTLDKNCQTVISVPRNSSVNVTPKAPVPYYTYSVFVSGAITEK